jgi:hypothetical protein
MQHDIRKLSLDSWLINLRSGVNLSLDLPMIVSKPVSYVIG